MLTRLALLFVLVAGTMLLVDRARDEGQRTAQPYQEAGR